MITSINPYTGNIIKKYHIHSASQVKKKIEQTHAAWSGWKETAFKERAKLLINAAAVLRKRKETLAALMASEMGKPLRQGIAEVEKCAVACEYYAANGADFLKDEIVKTGASKSFIAYRPVGVVLAIMPWNFPFWQVFRFLAPALMAGNCGLLKHASNVPGCALSIEEIIQEAGFPAHVFQNLLIPGSAVNQVIEHPLVKAVTLTGSNDAGSKVAARAGALIKKTVLELGGSDPYLILADADLEHAAETCADSRMINNGQSCIAAKRFIVEKAVEKDFIALFRQKLASKIIGDPFEEQTQAGPLARFDLREQLHQQVLESIALGAKAELGCKIPPGKAALYPPSILTGVKKGMPAYDEELFGPVAAVISAKDEDDAIRIANDTAFGLGAAVFTRDVNKGEKIAATQLQAGSCFVNGLVASDPRLPFGGIHESGYGRELGYHGIREFVNIKTVVIS
jgi:succinate-semialdehyde dehydrogenase/glutarate-semialdehyde dehydrogenase